MKKQLFLLVMMLLPMVTSAFSGEAVIDGIKYLIVTKAQTAEVIAYNYSGEIVIPATIVYDDIECNVTSIAAQAFYECTELTSICIPNSVTTIGKCAFANCRKLNHVDLSNSISTIEDFVFSGCSELTSIIIPDGVINIGNDAFSDCIGLTNIEIPNSVTSIGQVAFGGCKGLTSISIPNNVIELKDWAFQNCSNLTSISLGKSMQSIATYVFSLCPELKDVYCYSETIPTTDVTVFNDSYINFATLHVPSKLINKYRSKQPWKNFKEIVSLEDGILEKPTINYENGKLIMSCATDGVEFVTDITNADSKVFHSNEIELTATYNISVYATKSGYGNSDVATATLCWLDSEPKTEGITDGVVQIPVKAVLIQSEGGILKVEGIDDGTPVVIYTLDGKQAGSAVCRNGAALVGTNIQLYSATIVKIGEKVIKIVIK